MTPGSDSSAEQPLINEAPIGIFQVDQNGQYIDINPAGCEMLGYPREELLEMSIADLAPVDTHPDAIPHFEKLKQSGHSRTEGTLLHESGHEVEVIIDAVALDDTHFVAYVQEITERKEYERELEEQRNNLRVLNQVVRHDIRNDMTIVSGRAELLEKHVEEAGKEDLEAIQDSAESATELTKTARDLSEIMLSTEQDVEPVRLGQYLHPAIENIRTKFGTAVIITENRIPEAHVRGNGLLEAVFRNLLQNAVVHNDKEAPTVHIWTALNEETLTVAIADNGPGIPDSQKEAIFSKGEKDLDSPGTGLGLYLVETLVEQYGGDVWVEDNDPEGSVFFVELPLTGESVTE
jgi:PAS domain S-box-containing protein